MTVVLTGAAGFIGFHVASALLARGEKLVGFDDLNPYYDVRLKQARLDRLLANRGFSFHHLDISDREAVSSALASYPDATRIVHLAAQAGVRYSMVDPYAYVTANVMGHLVMTEAAARLGRLDHFVYASSSSVYGANRKLPFAETDRVDAPMSVYAATKRAAELISAAYGHLHGLPQTGLRFFTVYGPWGRPDMAYYSFARAIVAGEPITLYEGDPKRDFTYIDDIVQGVLGCLDHPPDAAEPARVVNIGNHRVEKVTALVALLEEGLGRQAVIHSAPRPRADVAETFADIDRIAGICGFAPQTPLGVGIPRFVDWFRDWHGIG